MVFASLVFLFAFLPLTLVAYFALPRRLGNGVLLVASLVFYLWGEGVNAGIVLASIVFNFALGARIGDARDAAGRRRWLAAAVAGNLGVLAVFKYADFAVANLDAALVALGLPAVAPPGIALPLGISFFTFHSISYAVDVYRGNATPQRRLADFALYILLFPQLIAGPIIRYKDIAAQIARRERRLEDVAEGVRRFVLGLGKKTLIANPLGAVADQVFAIPAGELTTSVAWAGIVCYTLQIYFDFSGYSDMAIGLMRMLGFRVLENFRHPYVAQSIREFWRRWHISLSTWFRDYLYVPLGGNQRGAARAYGNLVIVFLLCGLWHGARWTFVLWGIWHGLFLVLERAGGDRRLARAWRPLRHAYALCAVVGGWVLFRCETASHAKVFFLALTGLGAGPAAAIKYPVRQYLDPIVVVTLVAAVLGAMPIGRAVLGWLDAVAVRHAALRAPGFVGEALWIAAVLGGACVALAAGTYNPFIYFRF